MTIESVGYVRVLWSPEPGTAAEKCRAVFTDAAVYARTVSGIWWSLSSEDRNGWRAPVAKIVDVAMMDELDAAKEQINSRYARQMVFVLTNVETLLRDLESNADRVDANMIRSVTRTALQNVSAVLDVATERVATSGAR